MTNLLEQGENDYKNCCNQRPASAYNGPEVEPMEAHYFKAKQTNIRKPG